MTKYITRTDLEKYLKAMVILDVVMVPKKDDWLRLTSAHELEQGHAYVLDNGSGDRLTVMFTSNGTFIKGFDHENELNQFAADEWSQEFFEHTYANAPEEFTDMLSEDDIDETTFCMWCMDDTAMWMQNGTEGDDGGKEYLLGYICQTPEEWSDWAKYYYESEIALEIVQKVYNEEELTEEDVVKLNSECDAKEVLAELAIYQVGIDMEQ